MVLSLSYNTTYYVYVCTHLHVLDSLEQSMSINKRGLLYKNWII